MFGWFKERVLFPSHEITFLGNRQMNWIGNGIPFFLLSLSLSSFSDTTRLNKICCYCLLRFYSRCLVIWVSTVVQMLSNWCKLIVTFGVLSFKSNRHDFVNLGPVFIHLLAHHSEHNEFQYYFGKQNMKTRKHCSTNFKTINEMLLFVYCDFVL